VSAWVAALPRALAAEPAVVRVALASVLGSAPREAGTSMLVGAQTQYGSIGGGNLEYKALEIARVMLRKARAWQVARFPLGPALAQCCGGFVELWFERIEVADCQALLELTAVPEPKLLLATFAEVGERPRRSLLRIDAECTVDGARLDPCVLDALASMRSEKTRASLANAERRSVLLERLDAADSPWFVFGAGHVGSALIPMLSGLPFTVAWIDSREGAFPATLPANVTARHSSSPVEEVDRAPAGAAFVVLTHSHPLDYEICRAVLLRGDFRFAGLIGSETKAARFAHRFAREGIAAEVYTRLQCPIGIAGIASKHPSAIAVAIAAQLLSLDYAEQKQPNRGDAEGAEEDKYA
jgi:xanthine dehydrogenase accessory factor